MPFDLTDLELETAAQGFSMRLAACSSWYASARHALGTRAPIEDTARRAVALAERFEAARKEHRV
jgi:hypothetical protein